MRTPFEGNPAATLFDPLANLYHLRRTRLRVRFKPPAFRPAIGLIMVIYIAKKQTARGFMNYKSNILAHTYRPEMAIATLLEFVKTQSRVRRIYLEIESGGFDCLLLLARQAS